MPDQMSLPGLGAAPALFQPDVIRSRPGQLSGYNLFSAIFPQDEDAKRFGLVGAKLRAQHSLQGRCLQPQRLHTTLHAIAAFRDAVPQSCIDAAKAAAASVSCPPLSIVFNRAGSFSNNSNPEDNAFVLRCDARSNAAVAQLLQALSLALRRSGLHPKSSSTPHMTMLYDRRVIPEHPIEPICWMATR